MIEFMMLLRQLLSMTIEGGLRDEEEIAQDLILLGFMSESVVDVLITVVRCRQMTDISLCFIVLYFF